MTAMFRTLNINKTAGLVYADSNEDVHVLGKYNPDDPDTINPILEKIAQDDLTNAISFSYRYDDGLHRMAAHCAYYATRKELELREITLGQHYQPQEFATHAARELLYVCVSRCCEEH